MAETSNELRKLQNVEFEMLCDFKEVCEKHNLKYFLSSGTLLGAIRHKGFIPWDDDVDVAMPYDDYRRFLELAPDEFENKYFVQNCETENNFPSPFTKIRKESTLFLDSQYSQWHINHGIWIDVFPIIRMNRSDVKKIRRVLKLCKVLQMDDLLKSNPSVFKKIYGKIGITLLKLFYALVPFKVRKNLHLKLLNKISRTSHGDSCIELTGSSFYMFPCKIFEGKADVEFEDVKFSGPAEYNQYLYIHYGDYMRLPPYEERKGIHADLIDFTHSFDEFMKMKIS